MKKVPFFVLPFLETEDPELKKHLHSFFKELTKNRNLFLMLLPALIYIIVFSYVPMAGMVLAFKNYRYDLGIFKSPWNGLENFRYLFSSGTGWTITRNTILYNLINLITSQALAIVIAVFITEIGNKYYKKITQSVIFLPYFISWVIVGLFVFAIFNYETGMMNNLVTSLGGDKINLYAMPGVWPFIICAFNSWKWCGYNSVIYIAAITGVDSEIYEAAAIDGATIFKRIWHVTLPCIKPTVITIFLLQIGRILRGDFDMFYQIIGSNGQLYGATDIIDTYVFRSLTSNAPLGMTSAASFYQSVVCFITIMLVNTIVKKIDEDYALF